MLLLACFLAAGSPGDDPSVLGRPDPLLLAGFLAAGSSLDSSAFVRLDPAFVVSAAFSAALLGRLPPLLLSFFTAGVLGFLAGAPLLTGVAFGGGGEDSFAFFIRAERMAVDAFLAGDFFARVRPLRLALDWLALRDFLAGGGRRALGGGLF